MATGFVTKQLNKIQAERAKGLSDSGVKDAIRSMAAAGEFPKGKVYVESDTTDKDGLRTLVFFDKEKSLWVFQQSIRGKVQYRFAAPTREQVFDQIDAYAKKVEDANSPDNLIVLASLSSVVLACR
jgi:hypothetical protein